MARITMGTVGGLLLTALGLSACGDDSSPGAAMDDSGVGSGGGQNSGGQNSDGSQASSGGQGDPGGDDGGIPGDGGSQGGGGDASSERRLTGGFSIQLVNPSVSTSDGHITLLGKLYDGPQPEIQVLQLVEESGGCQLLEPYTPFCDPGCGEGVCVADEQCMPYPNGVDVGDVTVTGLGDRSFEALLVNHTYQAPGGPSGVDLGFDALPEGQSVQISASGGDYAPFVLEGRGIAPLVLSDEANGDYRLDRGAPFRLAWTPPSMPDISKIKVKLDISHHGGFRGKIECVVEDTGSLEIPAGMVDKLLDLGVAGFPSVEVTRSAETSADTAQGTITLTVTTFHTRLVQIEGLTSCSDDSQCPQGQSCQDDLTCG